MKRSLWRLLWNNPREAAFDVSLWFGLEVFAYALSAAFPTTTPPEAYSWIGGPATANVIGTLLGLTLLVRRRFPMTLMSIVTVLTIAQTWVMEFGPGPLLFVNVNTDAWVPGITPFIIYAVAVYATGWRRRIVGWVLVGVVTVVAFRPWTLPGTEIVGSAVVTTVLPTVLGLYHGARRRLMHALRERAERAEHEQHLLAEQARADERTRLASEMHDVVTHRVSLMVLQAGALGVTAQEAATRSAAEELRANGCQALEELRDLVGVLRRAEAEREDYGDPATAAPLTLSELVEQSEAVGVPVELVEEGNRAMVSPAVGRTAYRVVQEALTNVHKHAWGARVRVSARYGGDRVRLNISNTVADGSLDHGLADSGSGAGLLGLKQRVEMVGGTLRAEAIPGGGFEVDATLPGYVPTGESATGE